MGGRSKSSSQQQSSSGLDPELRARQLANIDRATGVAQGLQARQFVGPTAGMTQAQDVFSRLTTQAPQQVQAGSFLNKNLQAYMNPYQQAVIDTALADIERSRQLNAQQTAAQAVRARAFGGSRQAVAQAESDRAALEQAARTSAQLRAQGFEAATGLMGQELSLEQQAALANQAAGLTAAQQQAAAAQQLYGIGQDTLAIEQARLDAARNLELERQQIINQALGLNVGGGSGMTSQSAGASRGSSFSITG